MALYAEGVGSIVWAGLTDVRGLRLAESVRIQDANVIVYKPPPGVDQSAALEAGVTEPAPPRGSGLNKAATITFEGVHPAAADSSAEALAAYEGALRQHIAEQGAEWEAYDAERGILSFRVQHMC